MRLINNIKNFNTKYKNPVITIGNFDGVHLGHQALLHEVIEKADELNGTSMAMTFEPHPMRVLKSDRYLPLITLYEQKIELIEKSGIDVLICLPFNRQFASIAADDFIDNLLLDTIGIKAILVGKDYTFGKNRVGNINLLKKHASQKGFEVIVSNWIPVSGNCPLRISSTKIRKLVLDGKIEEARQLLGRFYQIRGVVVPGRNRGGRLLGCPTANINLRDELCPKMGVYAVIVECLNYKYKGVANIGYSPTFTDQRFTVEVHILNFNENIYKQQIRVNFIKHIRDEKKFSNINELSKQIKKDIKKADELLPDS
ncbi:MAG: bifunctional riboflavin kinase/FAD synthetase [Deltaproteobacteria bacterium]|nr:bifunctional riboflavin kinase/FAD synthetase [Deltaproteobacteria bacterium]